MTTSGALTITTNPYSECFPIATHLRPVEIPQTHWPAGSLARATGDTPPITTSTFDERFALMVEREYLRRQPPAPAATAQASPTLHPRHPGGCRFHRAPGAEEDSVPGMGSGAVAQPAPQPHRHGANRRRENLPGLCVGRPSLQAGLHRPLYFKNRRTPRRKSSLPRSTAPSPNCASNWPPLTSSFWMNGSAMLSPPNDAREHPRLSLMTAIGPLFLPAGYSVSR